MYAYELFLQVLSQLIWQTPHAVTKIQSGNLKEKTRLTRNAGVSLARALSLFSYTAEWDMRNSEMVSAKKALVCVCACVSLYVRDTLRVYKGDDG